MKVSQPSKLPEVAAIGAAGIAGAAAVAGITTALREKEEANAQMNGIAKEDEEFEHHEEGIKKG